MVTYFVGRAWRNALFPSICILFVLPAQPQSLVFCGCMACKPYVCRLVCTQSLDRPWLGAYYTGIW